MLDVATGSEREVYDESRGALPGQVFPQAAAWRADGSAVVIEGIGNHAASGITTVFLDGRAEAHAVATFRTAVDVGVSPNGLLYAGERNMARCRVAQILIDTDTIEVVNLETGDTVATFQDPDSHMTRQLWSPDSSELLFSRRLLPPPEEEEGICGVLLGHESEALREWSAQPQAWALLRPADRSVEPVEDPGAVLDRWHGPLRPGLVCAVDGREPSDQRTDPNGGMRAQGCGEIQLVSGGSVLATAQEHDLYVLGTIEVPAD